MFEAASRATAPLVFLHIRKTAGSAVRNTLANRFPAARTLLDWHELPQRDRDPAPCDFITGHVLPAELEGIHPAPRVLVVLRRPLDRALSAYHYYRGHSPDLLQHFHRVWPSNLADSREAFWRAARSLSLSDFLQQESDIARAWLENVQTRTLAGFPDGFLPPAGELLTPAVDWLNSCEFVGLTETLPATLDRVAQSLGWGSLGHLPRVNPTPRHDTDSTIAPLAREILEDWNRLDAELYLKAQEISARQLATGTVSTEAATLPEALRFTFDQPIHGRGWHAREQFGEDWICWTGVEQSATLSLRLNSRGPHRLECRVAHVLTPETLEGLVIAIGTRELALKRVQQESAVWVTAEVPSDALPVGPNSQVVTLQIRVPKLFRPCDLSPGCGDSRSLGIALAEIRLRPASD